MTQVVVGRLLPPPVPQEELSVSVIVPCKDEKGNVEDAAQRIPQLGRQTEIIFCDDQSTDGTAEEVLRVQSLYPEKDIRLEHGPGVCKSRNVWTGFDAATGDIFDDPRCRFDHYSPGASLLCRYYHLGAGGVCQRIATCLSRAERSDDYSQHVGQQIFQCRIYVPPRTTRKGYALWHEGLLEKRLGAH